MKSLLLIMVLIFRASIIGAADHQSIVKSIDEEVTKAGIPDETVTALELYESYELNSIRADKIYLGNIILVTGDVRRISRDPVTGIAYVGLAPHERVYTSINCYFAKNRESDIARIYSTQRSVKLMGKLIGNVPLEIMLAGCRIVK